MRPISCFLFGLSLLTIGGCGGGNVHSQLVEVDSLILSEQHDSAYHLIMLLDKEAITNIEDQSHYQLLMTQISLLVGRPLTSDSQLDSAINYYQQTDNKERLADAYYYKGIGTYTANDALQSMTYLKKAEEMAETGGSLRQRYKIAECISFVNNINGKYDLALNYAKKALQLSKMINNKRWLVDAYYRVGDSYSHTGMSDSAMYYFSKMEPYMQEMSKEERPYMLSNLALAYMDKDQKKAKTLIQEALSYKETTRALEYLSEILYNEGNEEESYQLLKRALTVNDLTPKDNIIHNLLEYDIEHGNTDKVCEQVNEIIAIKDSIINKVKNDTIKDLQTRYDHQVAMNAAHERTIWWQRSIGILLVTILLVTIYAIRYRNKLKLKLKNRQIKINQYISQLNELESKKLQADLQISSLQDDKEKDCQEIISLKNQKSEADEEIQQLKKTIKDLSGQEISKIRIGYELLSDVEDNKCVRNWPTENYEAFLAYYDTINHDFLRSVAKKYKNLTPQNVFYLVLKNMKKSKDEIATIFGISKESLRSIEFRLNKKANSVYVSPS